LPKSIAGPGIPLPPEQDTLISPNYQLAIPKKRTAQAIEETEEDEDSADPNQSQEQKTDPPQLTPQRVSFPLTKRPKWELYILQRRIPRHSLDLRRMSPCEKELRTNYWIIVKLKSLCECYVFWIIMILLAIGSKSCLPLVVQAVWILLIRVHSLPGSSLNYVIWELLWYSSVDLWIHFLHCSY
jgi:transcription initiation factor TFIID subunit 9B